MSQPYVYFHRYSLGEAEKQAVLDTLESGWITKGPKVGAFEQAFCDYTKADQALALNSCTAGLHVAMLALGIGPGDEVITTPLTFVATVNMILACGATPILADVSPDSFNLDIHSVEAAITPRTKAIVPVHLAGQPCDLSPLLELAKSHGIWVIDDAAHAVGAHYQGRPIGSWCDATAFSFYATKNITTGEGGMLTSPHSALMDKARPLSLHGLSKDAWKRYSSETFQHYLVDTPGFKYNMSDLQAALGLEQLKKCDALTAQRKNCVERYRAELSDLPLRFQSTLPESKSAYHLFQIALDPSAYQLERDGFLQALQSSGIGCAVHFIPVHHHPYYQRTLGYQDSDLPIASQLGETLISLPLYPDLSLSDQDYVISTFRQLAQRSQR
ncbi:MAG: DegT/DnrJ/EryC1/StrS family aminotransferase [Candidatus Sericytochromatia bacterium]